MRETYRGYRISSSSDGNGCPIVRVTPDQVGRHSPEWSQLGTGDLQVGRDYVDEKLDGVKRRVERGAGLEALLAVVAKEWEAEKAALLDRVLELEEELRNRQTVVDVRKGQLMGMFFLDGSPSAAEVKKAARKQYKRWHPDQGGDAVVFQRLKAAEEELLKLC